MATYMYKPEVLKKKYINWVKAHLAVLFTKEGIEPFVFDEIQQFQQKCLDDICKSKGLLGGTTCSSCLTENVVVCPTSRICNAKRGKCSFHRNSTKQYRSTGCPNNICSKFKCKILSAHRYYCPSFRNTDATKWCTNPWEVAKCFMPPEGYRDVTSVAKTDFNGIVSVIINHKGFQQKIQEQLGNKFNIFEKAGEIGSTLKQSSNLEVEDKVLNQYFSDLKSLLSVPGYFETDEHIKASRKKLLQLEYDTLAIDKADIRKVLDNAEKVVTQRIKTETDKQRKVTEELNLEMIRTTKRHLDVDRGQEMLTSTALERILNGVVVQVRKIDTTKSLEVNSWWGQTRKEPYIIENVKSYKTRLNVVAKQPKRDFRSGFWSVFHTNRKQAEEMYLAMTKDLKKDLIKWYRDNHSVMPLSPLCDEHEAALLSSYIVPEMNCFDVQTVCGSEIKSRVESLTDVFWTIGRKNELRENKSIYVVGDAGCGKTAFIKYLTLAWCQAHSPDPQLDGYFSEEELKHMRVFEFLFLVNLRDSLDVCAMDDMILNKCILKLPNSDMTMLSLQEILHHEKTIVMLDGMDEWTHSGDGSCTRVPKQQTPHKCARDHCTVVTTLRPWKFSYVSLKNSQVDNRLELQKLSKETVRKLGERAVASLKPLNPSRTENLFAILNEKITENCLEDFVSNPLLLLHLACLFYEDPSTAQSKSKICSSIIDLYLARTLIKPGPKQLCKPAWYDIPQCFREEDLHEKYHKLLMNIGKLAFRMLFSEDQRHMLVMKDIYVEDYLCPEDLKMGLLTGILTAEKVMTLVVQYINISFPHKTLQEYLCAKYMSLQSIADIEETILTGCRRIQDILDMSTVFEFVGGMNKRLLSDISRKLMPVIDEDEATQIFRTRTCCDKLYSDQLKNLQNMFMACIKDTPEDKEIQLFLQDFFIHNNHETENYGELLGTLLKQDKDKCHIKSIFIDNMDSCRFSEIKNLLAESDLSNVKKVFYRGRSINENLATLLVDKLNCLTLIFENNINVGNTCCIPPALCGHIVSLQHLEYICIMNFTICHGALDTIFKLMSKKKDIKEVRLHKLSCAEHGISCRGFNLDMSKHSDLKRLGFGNIPLSQLSINVSALEECHVGELSKPGLVPTCFQRLTTAEKLHAYVCSDLTSYPEIEKMRQTLPLLLGVKQLTLNCINLGQMSLTLSPDMVNIELVQLYRVTISDAALHGIVTIVEILPQSVTVQLQNCNIAPEIELKNIKEYISLSGQFTVLFDGNLSNSEYLFAFKTIKQSNEPVKKRNMFYS